MPELLGVLRKCVIVVALELQLLNAVAPFDELKQSTVPAVLMQHCCRDQLQIVGIVGHIDH